MTVKKAEASYNHECCGAPDATLLQTLYTPSPVPYIYGILIPVFIHLITGVTLQTSQLHYTLNKIKGYTYYCKATEPRL